MSRHDVRQGLLVRQHQSEAAAEAGAQAAAEAEGARAGQSLIFPTRTVVRLDEARGGRVSAAS